MAAIRILALSVVLGALGCAHVAKTDTTPPGKVEIEAGVGGPIANIPSLGALPLPLTSLGASIGLKERWDVSAHLHPTAALFKIAGVDVGTSYRLVNQLRWRPAVLVTGRLYGFTNFTSGFRPYLEVEVTPRWRYGKRWATYVVADALFQLFARPILNFGIGQELRAGRVALQLEGRWYQPGQVSRFAAVDWAGISGSGAFGLLFGIRIELGDDS